MQFAISVFLIPIFKIGGAINHRGTSRRVGDGGGGGGRGRKRS